MFPSMAQHDYTTKSANEGRLHNPEGEGAIDKRPQADRC